jgi:hypothetical protein
MRRTLVILLSLGVLSTLNGCYIADPYPASYPTYSYAYPSYDVGISYWEYRRPY